jgi:hypothetical protein
MAKTDCCGWHFGEPGSLDGDPTYSRLWAREFRYDGPRQRYLVRELSSMNMAPISDGIWTEFVGDAPMADYDLNGGGNELKRYNPGVSETDVASGETAYLHSDQLASTWFTSDDPTSGPLTLTRRAVRTAFGEIVYIDEPVDSRYGYAGGWGYETHDIDSNGAGDGMPDNVLNAPVAVGFPFMHVGARYYDPATGRFLQRDPIGIRGGSNVYAYTDSAPTNSVDPSGLYTIGVGVGGVGYLFGGGQLEVGIHIGWGPQGISIGGTLTGGVVMGIPPYAGVGVQGTFTTADDVALLCGRSVEMAVDSPVFSISQLGAPGVYDGGQVSFGPGVGMGARVGVSDTAGGSVNLPALFCSFGSATYSECMSVN